MYSARLNHGARRADEHGVQRRISLATACFLVALLVLPGLATACSIPIRKIGPVNIGAEDIRTPVLVKGGPGPWKLDATWTSVEPRMSQYVQILNGPRFHGSSFSGQKAMSIDAYAPEDLGWLYVEDADPDTPPCAMLGRSAWQAPQIFVRETKTRVFVAAASQPTPGNNTGCVLGPDFGVRPCPILTRRIMKLRKVVGARKIVFEHWGPQPSDEQTPIMPPRPS